MVLKFGEADGKSRYSIVKDEVANFRKYFKKLVLEFAFSSFIEQMVECDRYLHDATSVKTIIVLNIYGSIVDLTEMLTASCKAVKKFEYFVASAAVHPLDFYNKSLKVSKDIPLVFIPNAVSEQYMSGLVEILAGKNCKAVLAVGINDSHSVTLSMEQETKVHSQMFSAPNPLEYIRKILHRVAFNYSTENALITSPAVVKDAHTRFVEHTLSLLYTENYLALCVARSALEMKKLQPLAKRLKKDTDVQLIYGFSFCLFHTLNKQISGLNRFDEFLQFSTAYFEKTMIKMKAFYSQNPLKFKQIIDEQIQANSPPSSPLADSILNPLKEVSERLGKTKWITQSDLIKENLTKKVSQRKPLGTPNTSTFGPLFESFVNTLREGIDVIKTDDELIIRPNTPSVSVRIKREGQLDPIVQNIITLGMM